MTLWKEYRQPVSISEAIKDLQSSTAPVIPIAGGTDLLLDIKQGRHAAAHTMIDLTGIPEMNLIEIRADELFIGAAVPINRITANTLVREHATALVEACNLIAGPQVRNTATLGGNVAHALPAADGTISMVALNAQVEIAHPGGLRRMAFIELFLGPGKSAIDKTSELIAGFYLPKTGVNEGSCFKRIMRPQGVALPILNCAVWIERASETITDIRIAVGPGGPTPFRAKNTESVLRGNSFTEEYYLQALEEMLAEAKFRTSPRRATSDYRRYIIAGLFKDTLAEAWERAA